MLDRSQICSLSILSCFLEDRVKPSGGGMFMPDDDGRGRKGSEVEG